VGFFVEKVRLEHIFLRIPRFTLVIISLCSIQQSHYRSGQTLRFKEDEAPRFQDNWHMKVVRLSALRFGHLYPQEVFLTFLLEAEITAGP